MTRPSTPDVFHANGRRTVTVKRICDGCGENIGDATTEELEAAIMGRLPSVIHEHGCAPETPIEKIDPAATPQEGTPTP